MLTIKNMSKRYNNTQALKDVSLTIPEGSCYGLIGPNGAGKSTLMKVIATIVRSDSGDVIYNQKKFHNKMKQNIGYIPQEVCLEQTVTAKENLYFFGRLYGLKGEKLKQRTADILSYTGLSNKGTHKVTTFSGGMKRRLNIGCALMHQPSFILMDEPTVGIDPQSRRYIFDMIENLKNTGCTIIYASHYIEEVEQLCDAVAFIDHGEMIESGKLDVLLKKYTQPAVFVQGENCLPPKIAQSGKVQEKDDGFMIRSDQPLDIMENILQFHQDRTHHLNRLELLQPRLEDVFFSLTGNQLRD